MHIGKIIIDGSTIYFETIVNAERERERCFDDREIMIRNSFCDKWM